MSEFRCFNCPGRHFSTLLEAVKHVMSERGTGKGSGALHVQCCIQGCSKRVRKLRLHIRKAHKKLCPLPCPDCQAKFVERNDLNNHLRNGCPRRKHTSCRVTTPESLIGTGKGSRGVQCRLQGCSKEEPKLRLHIRKTHKELCPLPCPDCQAKFVEQIDLYNHLRQGCHRRKDITYRVTTPESLIETFFQKVGFRHSSSVNYFIANELQLDEDSRDEVSQVVDKLYKHLQHESTFSINQLVKGGSIGKGTAVKDKADIDCVIFLNDVKTVEEHKSNLQTTKDHLESCLKQSPFNDQITFEGQTPFAVKFKLRLNSREFSVDLLPTFTTNLTREELYDEMIGCETKDKGYYSAHFVSLQKEFVKERPPIVKNLIRLVKYWRKTCFEDKSTVKARLPTSYPLELITIACWEEAKKPISFDIRAGFKAVLVELVNNCHINFRWYKYYSEALAKRGIKGMKTGESPPFVLDPANPTNNVCSASDVKGWQTVADVAEMTLQRKPLKDIIFNSNWQIEDV